MYQPMRTCSVCRKKMAKSELFRVVKVGDEFVVDLDGKAQGRGAYICKCKECVEKCVSKKVLNRSFKTQVGEEIYDALGKLDI